MQITFNPIINNTNPSPSLKKSEYSNYVKTKTNNNLMNTNAVYFMGKINAVKTIGKTGIKKITSEKEYDEALNRLKNSQTWWHSWSNIRLNKYEEGLMPYIGESDISRHINGFMRDGHVADYTKLTSELLTDYVRVMDYALEKVDEVYGKYEGIVYRYGRFDTNPQNFISSARKPNGAAKFADERHSYKHPFRVIYTKNGHKVEEIQKKVGTNQVYIEETEIILNPDSHYEIIDDITPEMEAEKEKIRKALREENDRVHGFRTIFYREV